MPLRLAIALPAVLSFTLLCAATPPANAQPDVQQAAAANLSPRDILKQAKSLRDSDARASAELAALALANAQKTDDFNIAAQAHVLLAKLAKKNKNSELALHHFLQASHAYRGIGDTQKQITAAVDYIKVLYSDKDFKQGIAYSEQLLPIAESFGDALLIGLVHDISADGFYKLKQYQQAIAEYARAEQYLAKNVETNLRAQPLLAATYHQVAQAYKKLNDTANSIVYFKKALALYQLGKDKSAIAQALKNIASGENRQGNYVAALDYSLRSLEQQKQLDAPTDYAELSQLIGMIYRNIGDYERSLEYIQEARRIYQRDSHIARAAEASNQLGLIYSRLNQYDHARSYYQQSIDLPEDKVSRSTLAAAYRELGVIDYKSGQYQHAMTMFNKAQAIYGATNDTLKLALLHTLTGKVCRAMGNDASAQTSFEQALAMAQQVGDLEIQIRALSYLGRLFLVKDTNKAMTLLLQALALTEVYESSSDQLSILASLKNAEKIRGNNSKALDYAEQEIALSKVINGAREQAQLAQAKAKLDSHKMERDLVALREKVKLDGLKLAQKNSEIEIIRQANRISELELTKNQYANVLLAALLGICLLVAFYIYRNFAASRSRNKELDYLATHDPLTNCYNRRYLFERIKRDFIDLEANHNYSLLMADIDLFKEVNDSHGHTAGDDVLRGVANVLQGSIRHNDIAARYGGEEFCIILPGADAIHAVRIAETLRQKIENSSFGGISITCSFGVASVDSQTDSPSKLIDQADTALYQSKSQGRNRVTLWDKSTQPTT